jgi:hypothetical protein
MTSTVEINPNQQSETAPVKYEPILGKAPEPIFGQIINLLYLGGSENLQAIVVQDEKNPQKFFILGVDPDGEFGSDMIKINNLNNFEAKFEKIFYSEYYIKVEYADNQIKSIAAVACLPISSEKKEADPLTGLYRSPCCSCNCNPRCRC